MAEAKRPKGVCVDCWIRAEDSTMPPRESRSASSWRAAPHPGPRCFSDHQVVRKARKAKAQVTRDGKVYGLAPGGYDALLLVQSGRCAICRRATGATRRLSVEHDHRREHERRGGVRGLACRPCNDLLGHCRDDPEMLKRAIEFLVNPPSNQLGDEWFLGKEAQ